MRKARKKKVKSIENEETTMATAMIKIVIATVVMTIRIIIMTMMRFKVGNCIKI